MRTGRSLTVCWSLLPGGCLLRGGVCSGGVSALGGGVCSQGGCLLPGGVSALGGLCLLRGVCSRGVSAPGGVSQHALRQIPPPPVNRMTNRCKNITLATTSLRPVIKKKLATRTFFSMRFAFIDYFRPFPFSWWPTWIISLPQMPRKSNWMKNHLRKRYMYPFV